VLRCRRAAKNLAIKRAATTVRPSGEQGIEQQSKDYRKSGARAKASAASFRITDQFVQVAAMSKYYGVTRDLSSEAFIEGPRKACLIVLTVPALSNTAQ
jgi:hypothetical protein